MEGDHRAMGLCPHKVISIHSLRMEGDGYFAGYYTSASVFQSTPSAWRETLGTILTVWSGSISIHSLRMEGDDESRDRYNLAEAFQSTPSAWRETILQRRICGGQTISIHSLRMEGDPPAVITVPLDRVISIHSLRMEGDTNALLLGMVMNISIHSLRMEGDILFPEITVVTVVFQSTPSAWRETNSRSSCSVT